MPFTFDFLQSEHVLALLIAILIFFTTILLVIKRWIGFSITLLLLLFSLSTGLIINYQQDFQHYFTSPSSSFISEDEKSTEDFHKQVLQAMEDLKLEVAAEKENLRRVMNQVQEIFNSMDMQKQKFQNFIGEVRERFKSDYPTNLPSEKSSQSTVSNQE